MSQVKRLTALIEREDDGFVSFCPELDIASQGDSIEEARTNLIEALTLFFEVAGEAEISRRLKGEVFITQVEVLVGQAPSFVGRSRMRNSGRTGFSAVRQKGSHRVFQKKFEESTISVPVPMHKESQAGRGAPTARMKTGT